MMTSSVYCCLHFSLKLLLLKLSVSPKVSCSASSQSAQGCKHSHPSPMLDNGAGFPFTSSLAPLFT
jgi:hypothetical protein